MTAPDFADPVAAMLTKLEELAREWPKFLATEHPVLRRQCEGLIAEIISEGRRARGGGS